MSDRFFVFLVGDIALSIYWLIFGMLIESGKANLLSYLVAAFVVALTIVRRA